MRFAIQLRGIFKDQTSACMIYSCFVFFFSCTYKLLFFTSACCTCMIRSIQAWQWFKRLIWTLIAPYTTVWPSSMGQYWWHFNWNTIQHILIMILRPSSDLVCLPCQTQLNRFNTTHCNYNSISAAKWMNNRLSRERTVLLCMNQVWLGRSSCLNLYHTRVMPTQFQFLT